MPLSFSSLFTLSDKRKRALYLAALLVGLPSVLLTWRHYGHEVPFIGWTYPALAGLIVVWIVLVLIRSIPIRWTEYFVQTSLALFSLAKYLALINAPENSLLLNELHATFWTIAILFVLGYILANHTIALFMALGYSLATFGLALWFLYPERYTLFLEVFRLQVRVAVIALLTFILAAVKDDLRKTERQAAILQVAANTDALTGLPNRRMMNELLENHLRGGLFCLLLVDIDYFKEVNDAYGHERGDEVLRSVAEALRLHSRATDIVGRWGGEEFLVLLDLQEAEAGIELAERLRQNIEALQPTGLRVTISLGGTVSRPGDSIASLTRRADLALYAAKSSGRNCVCWQDER